MKKSKLLTVLLSAALGALLAACGSTATATGATATVAPAESPTAVPAAEAPVQSGSAVSSETAESEAAGTDAAAGSRALVVYFSWSGNTEAVANEIAAQTGADIFEITPETPYTDDYDTLLDIAQTEQSTGARPAIAGSVENFAGYETVYFGYPNWWGDMPMILYSFLDDYDFTGKSIAPFVTSGGSGFSDTVGAITDAEPGAVVSEGLALGSSEAQNSADAVTEWLAALGLNG